MKKQSNLRRFRILSVGGAKARTNDNSGGPNFEDAVHRYTAA